MTLNIPTNVAIPQKNNMAFRANPKNVIPILKPQNRADVNNNLKQKFMNKINSYLMKIITTFARNKIIKGLPKEEQSIAKNAFKKIDAGETLTEHEQTIIDKAMTIFREKSGLSNNEGRRLTKEEILELQDVLSKDELSDLLKKNGYSL